MTEQTLARGELLTSWGIREGVRKQEGAGVPRSLLRVNFPMP